MPAPEKIPRRIGRDVFLLPAVSPPPPPLEAAALTLLACLPFWKATDKLELFQAYVKCLGVLAGFQRSFLDLVNKLHWNHCPSAKRQAFALGVRTPRHRCTASTAALPLADAHTELATDLMLRTFIRFGEVETGLEWLADGRGGGVVKWESETTCQFQFHTGDVLHTADVMTARRWAPEAGWRPASERMQYVLALLPAAMRRSVYVVWGKKICEATWRETVNRQELIDDVPRIEETSALVFADYILAVLGSNEAHYWNPPQKPSPPATTV